MNLDFKIKQPEGRTIEFKEKLPKNAQLAKTLVAFANDAGGEVFIGIKNNPRKIVGISEDELDVIENRISNLVNDFCNPTIFPEITFIEHKGKKVIRIFIHKGAKPPYHLKNSSIEKGTYIRVGSSNRLASDEIIAELIRQGKFLSFDAEPFETLDFQSLDYINFETFYQERTNEKLSEQVLKKLNLIIEKEGKQIPSLGLVLLADTEVRNCYFPNAKVECARFKGTTPGDFIDSKTIDTHLCQQAEEAYQFITRHISKGTKNYEGVFHNERWEYPLTAIREVIRNAIIHRDYSLTGKDIKIAVFDDKIEITSPGKLMPSIDFQAMHAGQSDVRNKILAPVFKRVGIIEQWGNGLKLIAQDLDDYPNIAVAWSEPGLSFRMTFIKTKVQKPYNQPNLTPKLRSKIRKELESPTLFTKTLLSLENETKSRKELALSFGQEKASGTLKAILTQLTKFQLIQWTIPEKPNSSKQKYKITELGKFFLKQIHTDEVREPFKFYGKEDRQTSGIYQSQCQSNSLIKDCNSDVYYSESVNLHDKEYQYECQSEKQENITTYKSNLKGISQSIKTIKQYPPKKSVKYSKSKLYDYFETNSNSEQCQSGFKPELQLELQQELQQETLFTKTLKIIKEKTSATKDIATALGQKSISGQLYQIINQLRELDLITWTIPQKPKSPKQQYKITDRGIAFLQILKNKT